MFGDAVAFDGIDAQFADNSRAVLSAQQEVEKLAAKKGVTIQSVKEVLQGLCDDDLVCMEKVGIQNVYVMSWPC